MRTLLGVLYDEFRMNQNLGLIAKRTLAAVNPRILAAAAFYDEIKKNSNHAVKALLPAARRFIQKGEKPQGLVLIKAIFLLNLKPANPGIGQGL